MFRLSNRLARAIFLVLMACLATRGFGETVPAERPAPRMWRITGVDVDGRGLEFFLWGVTHQGLAVEYDAYFSERVVPAFWSSTRFAYENALLIPATLPACKDPSFVAGEEAAIAAARAHLSDLVTRFHDQVGQRSARQLHIPPPVSFREYGDFVANRLSEFGLIVAIAQYRGNLNSFEHEAPTRIAGLDGRAPTAVLRAMRPELQAGSLDSPQDFVDVFCALGAARLTLLEATVQHDKALDAPADAVDLDASVAEATADFLRSFVERRASGTFRTDESFNDQFVCARNRIWLRKMLAGGDGVGFYAVGLNHLFADERDGARCPGLLGDLAQRGLSVVAIDP